MSEVRIVPLSEAHLAGLLVVERLCFATPWSENAFRYELEENALARYFAALIDDAVVGYGGMWHVLTEGHITNIAVHPDWRRRGIASKVLDTLLLAAIRDGIRDVTLEVRKSNAAAIALYASYGFVVEGSRPGYYQDNGEDALIMWRHFDD